MGPCWAEVICNYAMPLIDDVRLTDQMEESPALFFRRMSIYMGLAAPMLTKPPELFACLNEGLTKAVYADSAWVSTEESTEGETVVSTGLVGYELFSCSLRTDAGNGSVALVPAPEATYDPESGEVTFPIQKEKGLEYSLDFYTDGSFGRELTDAQKRLLGMAVGIVWDERFTRNWLNIQEKVKDSSFDTVNESTYMREAQNRLSMNRHLLNDELRKYEQDLAYFNAVSPRGSLAFL